MLVLPVGGLTVWERAADGLTEENLAIYSVPENWFGVVHSLVQENNR